MIEVYNTKKNFTRIVRFMFPVIYIGISRVEVSPLKIAKRCKICGEFE